MSNMNRTIVMIHPGGLGDVLLAVPAMVRLRTGFPNRLMALCAEDRVASLLFECGIVDAWVSVQGRHGAELFAGPDLVTGRVRTWLEGCDLAIAWMEDLDGKLNETLKAVGASMAIVRSPFSIEIGAIHQRERFLETIDETSFGDTEDIRLAVPESFLHLGQALLDATGIPIGQPLAVIHPGSGSPHKCVTPEVLAAAIDAMQGGGMIPVILEGPADREPVERLLRSCRESPVLLKGLDLHTVTGILAQADLYVGQDSGITHLAGLMGVRMVALFGPTDPARWAPRGANVSVIQGAPCVCRSWEEVSRCEEKPCLKIQQDDLVTCCLAHLKAVQAPKRIPSVSLVTDYPVC
jgi:ADP-heptose:LPS heptosyltransferase